MLCSFQFNPAIRVTGNFCLKTYLKYKSQLQEHYPKCPAHSCFQQKKKKSIFDSQVIYLHCKVLEIKKGILF